MNKKVTFTKIISIIISLFLFLGVLTLGFMNLFGTDELYTADAGVIVGATVSMILRTYITWQSFIKGAAVLIIVSLLICILMKTAAKEHTAKFGILVSLAAFSVRAAAVFLWKTEPVSDFGLTYDLSNLLATVPVGEWGVALDEYGTIYNDIWSAHMPFIIYQSQLMRLFGTSVQMLGVINAIWGTLECLIVWAISRYLFGRVEGRNAMLFMAFNPVCIFFTPILSNQHSAVCFFLLGVYTVCAKPWGKMWLSAFFAGLMFAMGQLLRPEMTAAVLAVAVYFAFEGVQNKKKMYSLLCCMIMMFSFFAVSATADKLLRDNEIIHQSMLEQNMKYKVTVGLDKATHGGWSEENAKLIYDEEKLDEVFWERMRGVSVPMLLRKTIYQFGSYVYSWSMKADTHPVVSSLLVRRASAAMMGMIIVFACMSMVFDNEKRKRFLPLVIFIGTYMGIYAIIEVQVRYNYIIVPLLIVLGSNITLTENRKKG